MGLSLARVNTQKQQPQAVGTLRTVLIDVTFDSSYPTGGETLVPATVGLVGILGVTPVSVTATHAGYHFRWASNKLLAYVAAGTQVTDTTDLSALTVRLLVVGY